MQLLSIISILATGATIIYAAPTSAPDNTLVELTDLPWGTANTSHTGGPADDDAQLDKRSGIPWSVIGYANRDCTGEVKWLGTGEDKSDCMDMRQKAGSMRIGMRGGTVVTFWNAPNRCAGAMQNPGDYVMGVNFPTDSSQFAMPCVTHSNGDIYGYEVTRQ